eukprot:TRINITY_DN4784_c0_g1_i1.p1 TRINITY_DN4784_c0_g1~~TRINITY_DN4784_c0_g1_i1.p1  ORF type:complete len:302 (-),score=38.33 TRINITY_DN4784_c0_g1_i1:96-1001(-)
MATVDPTLLESCGDTRDTNFPVDSDGKVYHLALKAGELANRILCVGDPQRAHSVKSLLDEPDKTFTRSSTRGFLTYTGHYGGVPISIVSIGMGIPMMDFFIREARHIIEGPMCVIRLGTCGTPRHDVTVGSIVVASSSVCVTPNYDYWSDGNDDNKINPYLISKPVKGDAEVLRLLISNLKVCINNYPIVEAEDVTCDSFYSSQGRIDNNFNDKNLGLINRIIETYPLAASIQMETFQLFHLARLSKGSVVAGACAIVLAQRLKNDWLSLENKHMLEIKAGRACLETLVKWNDSSQHISRL